jgi:hypothetical protein
VSFWVRDHSPGSGCGPPIVFHSNLANITPIFGQFDSPGTGLVGSVSLFIVPMFSDSVAVIVSVSAIVAGQVTFLETAIRQQHA